MNILVLAPMESEYKNFRNALAVKHKHNYRVAQIGVGKANAAANTALELYGNSESQGYDLIAVIGYAGGWGKLSQGDFIIPRVAKYHDTECPADIVPELSKDYDLQGSDNACILTGDTFITKDNINNILRKRGNVESVLFDMESTAVCQVADDADIPVLVMKLVSDIPSKDNNIQSFNEFVETHSNFSQFIHYLESLEEIV